MFNKCVTREGALTRSRPFEHVNDVCHGVGGHVNTFYDSCFLFINFETVHRRFPTTVIDIEYSVQIRRRDCKYVTYF